VISVHQEDCSTHEVHGRQNHDRRSLSGCVEQPKDWNWRIEDDNWSVLYALYAILHYAIIESDNEEARAIA